MQEFMTNDVIVVYKRFILFLVTICVKRDISHKQNSKDSLTFNYILPLVGNITDELASIQHEKADTQKVFNRHSVIICFNGVRCKDGIYLNN